MMESGQTDRVDTKGGLVVLSGPSGSGKTTLCRMLSRYDEVNLAVSATTRPKRRGEIDGKDYFFLTRRDFEDKIRAGDFVEYNEVFKNQNLYGSLRSEVEKGLRDLSRYYLMEIDVRGALNLKELKFEGRYIFIMPPSVEELRRRLSGRGTDSSVSIEERLKKAEWELEQIEHYDLVVTNNDLEEAFGRIKRYLRLC